jgi:hypothetical protein
MKKFCLVLLSIAVALGSYAQSDKNIVFDENAQLRKVGSFSGIEIGGAIDLYLSQGSEDAVAVSAGTEELLARIKTEVRGNILHIYFDGKGMNWRSWGNNKIKAYVTFKDIKRIEASGACNVKTTGKLLLSELIIEMSGASDFTGEADISSLRIDLSGASVVRIAGKAEKATFLASGASSIRAYDLITDYCKVDASGASGIRLHVNKELNASASGGSSISYKGDGVIRDISSSGAASVKRRND